jgi:hypothetical protein
VAEPFDLADGRRVAMLARVILRGQSLGENGEPCEQTECVVGLEQAEVATAASLPRVIHLEPDRTDSRLQNDATFYVGTIRANYLCDATGALSNARYERWIIGGPITRIEGNSHVVVIDIVRQGMISPTGVQPRITCQSPVCLTSISTRVLDLRRT